MFHCVFDVLALWLGSTSAVDSALARDGRVRVLIAGDGNCNFSAIADQLHQLPVGHPLRAKSAEELRTLFVQVPLHSCIHLITCVSIDTILAQEIREHFAARWSAFYPDAQLSDLDAMARPSVDQWRTNIFADAVVPALACALKVWCFVFLLFSLEC